MKIVGNAATSTMDPNKIPGNDQTAAAEAKAAATAAQIAASEAKSTATAANNTASAAQTAAGNAQTAAEEAKSAATAANNTASAAQTAAAEASTKAGNAQTAANNAQTNLTAHNTNTGAHADLRAELKVLSDRINAALDSDDTTLDELSEIVAYIKSNKTLIDAITTSKVSVSDIVDNLVTNVKNKPLSAAQGVALKALIEAIKVPTQLSELTGDATHRTVTDEEKTAWDSKLGQSDLQAAINTALAQAKASGKFDGKDGDDYVLTDSDMDDIAVIAMQNEKGSIVQQIIAELQGLPVFGVVDENKTITVTSSLSDGTYTLKYEYADGTVEDIGTIIIGTGSGSGSAPTMTGITAKYTGGNVTEGTAISALSGITVTATYSDGSTEAVTGYSLSGKINAGNNTITVTYEGFTATFTVTGVAAAPSYINLIPSAKTPTDYTTVFNNGKGYMDGKYASSASPYYGDDSATFVTGAIEATPTSVFYIKGVTIDTANNHNRLSVLGKNGNCNAAKPFTQMTDYATLETLGTQYYKLTMNTSYINTNFANFKYIMFSAMGSGANCIVSTTPIG